MKYLVRRKIASMHFRAHKPVAIGRQWARSALRLEIASLRRDKFARATLYAMLTFSVQTLCG